MIIPGAFDALSALLIERVGFKAIYISGAAQSVTQLGLADVGHITLFDLVRVVKNIRRVTSLPMIVDADTGFGGPNAVRQTVQALEMAGAAGVQIEDQVFPKRCGHLRGKAVISAQAMVKKIISAVKARRNKNFLIIARTDARAVYGLGEAVSRAQLYRLAGADVIFPEALESVAEFTLFGKKKNLGSLMANMTEFGLSPALPVTELDRLGYQLILFPMTTCRIAAHAMEEALWELKKSGTSRTLIPKMQTRRDLYKLIHYQPD